MSNQTVNSANSAPLAAPLVEGSIWRSIWIMSWPLLITTISNSFVGLVDIKVAMRLGSASQAAVGLAEHAVFLFMVFFMSTAIGTTAIVSRAFGENNRKHAIDSTAQSVNLALLMGAVFAVLCFFSSRSIIGLFTSSPEVCQLATEYLKIYSFILLPFSLVCIINAAFRAAGDAKTPLLIILVMTVINIVGDFVTVYGNWPVANLGVRGIALSGLIATSIGGLMSLFLLKFSTLGECFNQLWPIRPKAIIRVLKVGLPSALQRLGWVFSLFVIFFILKECQNPIEALASISIGMRIESILFMPMLAFSLAISSIIGQNLGAGETERAFKAGWQITKLGIGIMVALSFGMFFLAHSIAHNMSHDPNTINYTTSYLQINAFAEPFLALGMILSGALQGAGDTKAPMWITLTTQWFIRLPLAWLLATHFQLGPQGAWIAMASSVFCMGILNAMRYQSRAWIKTVV